MECNIFGFSSHFCFVFVKFVSDNAICDLMHDVEIDYTWSMLTAKYMVYVNC